MFKIIFPILIATALPLIAQTTTVEKDAASTTVTTTVTTDPVVVPTTEVVVEAEPTPPLEKTVQGIVSEINQGTGQLSVIVPDSSIPMVFVFNEQTEMMDLKAESVSWPSVKLGQAVTVTYVDTTENLVAKNLTFGAPDKLVPVPTAKAIIVTPPAPVVEETSTTTTTTTTETE